MAIRKAVADGNWSNTATWDGGTLPAATDDVYANGHAVSIDQSITVNTLRNIAGSGIVSNGGFTVTAAATVTITAGIQLAHHGGGGSLLDLNAYAAAVTINGNLSGGSDSGQVALYVNYDHTGDITINGNISAGSVFGAYGVNFDVDVNNITINGNISGGSSSGGDGIFVTGSPTIVITGDVAAGTNAKGVNLNGTAPDVTINGNVTGGTGANANGVDVNCAATVEIVGNVTGAAGPNSYGVYAYSGTVSIIGDIKPGSYLSGVNGSFAVWSDGTSDVRAAGHVFVGGVLPSTGPNGFWPFRGKWRAIAGEDVQVSLLDTTGSAVLLRAGGGGGGGEAPTSGVGWPPRYYL